MKKNLILILVLMIIISCNQNSNTKDSKNSIPSQKADKIGFEQKEKSEIDSSLITCHCPNPYSDASIQLRIDYFDDFVKLCTWFYDKSKKDINEFQIFDSNDKLIFEGFPPSEYKVISIKQPLTIRQMTSLPDKKENWRLTPIYDIQIIKIDSVFKTNTKFILEPPKLDNAFQDSIYQIYKNQPRHNGNYNKQNPPFVNERYIVDLFLCAINNNAECINAYDSLNTRFVTDGANGELYYELLGILSVYKSNDN